MSISLSITFTSFYWVALTLNAFSVFSFICLLFRVASTVFFFVRRALPGNVDICKEANGCTSHLYRCGTLCFDVNIWNVNSVYSSAWVSSNTNKTVNPFSLCVCELIRDMPLPCCGFVSVIIRLQGVAATVLQLCHCPYLSLFTSYQRSMRCDTRIFFFG